MKCPHCDKELTTDTHNCPNIEYTTTDGTSQPHVMPRLIIPDESDRLRKENEKLLAVFEEAKAFVESHHYAEYCFWEEIERGTSDLEKAIDKYLEGER